MIFASASLTELAVPAGDSIYRPGWDGYINAISKVPWVPSGISCWEIGCNKSIKAKAEEDFNKRVKGLPKEFRVKHTYVFVTPRRWHKKNEWLEEKRKLCDWKQVCIIDADDIEAWLEQAPSVALEFSEQLGLSGDGIESINRYWNNWSEQSRIPITVKAMLAERELAQKELITQIENNKSIVTVEADSREEATAFACAALLEHSINAQVICITAKIGWRFVDVNPHINIVVCSEPESAKTISPKAGQTLIVPICHGDNLNRNANTESCVSIPRITPSQFEKTLIDLGEEESDAKRYSTSIGRSWSVYRRTTAKNPLVASPSWLMNIDFECLSVLMLVGAWNSNSTGDKAVVESMSGLPYEKFEQQLRQIVGLDDSPIIQIGSVWKAKSPLELVYLIAPKLSADTIRRFLKLVEAIFIKPDPSLELEEKDRFMASIYGKVREQSGIILDSIVNSLGKLKVYAETNCDPISTEINLGVENLIHELFYCAEEERWLSLADYLPEFSEASPSTFLKCIEASLNTNVQPVKVLIKRTTGAGMNSKCWHSGLLWALEVIAWNPSKFSRVTQILAELDNTPTESTWANTPFSTLVSFFRVHWPQTLATSEQKIAILKRLIKTHENIAWRLCLALMPSHGGSICMNNARPKWRGDDAGSEAERGKYYPHYLSEIGRVNLDLANKNPTRISELIDYIDNFEGDYREELLTQIENAVNFDDQGKEVVLGKLRKHLSFHNTDDIDTFTDIERLTLAYKAIIPDNLIIKNRWLFTESWVELPEGERSDYKKNQELVAKYRADAVEQIFEELSENGIIQLKNSSSDKWLVGKYVTEGQLGTNVKLLMNFTVKEFIKDGKQFNDPFLDGVISCLAYRDIEVLLNLLPETIANFNLDTPCYTSLLSCLPPKLEVLNFIETLPQEIANNYWQIIKFNHRLNEAEREVILDKFILFKRYRSAFSLIKDDYKEAPAKLVYDILKNILHVDEPNAELPNSHWLFKAIEYIQTSDVCSRLELALLEFGYFPLYHKPDYIPPNLKEELLHNPSLFVELICYCYKKEGKYSVEKDITSNKNTAELSWKVIHYGRGTPGLTEDGTVNEIAFNDWIEKVRRKAKEFDRETMTDQTIGQWLTKCPEEEEGIWPCYPVCELLEKAYADEIRSCFKMGVRNNRGVTTKSYGERGTQEIKLATIYRNYADKVHVTYPLTADMLEQIALSYEQEAKQEDDRASINIEID
ncbi:hypothetical protein [Colwellia sp. PAMC 21821]|uniref:hypothetical protein n=1 Tax=Colwellia sp. PAMC 21821 TaxID=1816219 RepID=UPI0018C8D038|nr:hypothetical protein [Colwellia sp. PAMC 21821]